MENKTQWSKTTRYLGLIAILIAVCGLLYISKSSLGLIFFAALIAYVLTPLITFGQNTLHMSRKIAVIFAYVILIILIILLISEVIPLISDQINRFVSLDWPQVINGINSWLDDLIQKTQKQQLEIGTHSIDLTPLLLNLQEQISSFDISAGISQASSPGISNIFQNVISVSANIITKIISTLILILTTAMASIYFSSDGYKAKNWLVNLFPENYQPEIRELLTRLVRVWNNYFAGEIKLMVYIGSITAIVCYFLGIRWAALLGIIAGFCEIVPNIGPIISCFPALISAAIFRSSRIHVNVVILCIIVIIAYIVIQQTENLFIVPHLMGNALDIHPAVIILGIMILSSRLGIWGALLASPLIGLIKEIFYFVLHKVKGEDPYPDIYSPKVEVEQKISYKQNSFSGDIVKKIKSSPLYKKIEKTIKWKK